MRVSVLKKNLLSPCSFPASPTPMWGLRVTDRSLWVAAASRTPSFQNLKQAQPTKVLDRGFFFPISTPWVHGGVAYKKLSIRAKGQKALTAALCRTNSIWEALEGGALSLMRGGVKPGIRPSHEGYSSSHSLNFYGGVKPYRRRKRKKTQAKPALKPTGGVLGLSRKKTKKIAGFRKALRLVPRKKRKARSYRYLKSLRPRTLLWRTARFSRLKTPLAWSKGGAKLNKATAQLGLRGALPKLSPKVPNPSKAYEKAGGVFSAHMPRLTQWGVRKKKNFRVPQARYKPGLSKAWRLLRLQFCLAWGLPWLRQRRFTNYVSQLDGITGLNFIKMCVSSVGFVVKASSLTAPSASFGDKAFVNGQHVYNPFFQVFRGDRVAVAKQSMPSTKRWVAFTNVVDIPPIAGWEVDGLARSTTIWAEPTLKELSGLTFSKPLPFLTFRMYNWKYRH